MKINSIEWHKHCLKNSLDSEERMKIELARLYERLTNLSEHNKFYQKQIDEAEKRGLSSFDSNKLLIKR